VNSGWQMAAPRQRAPLRLRRRRAAWAAAAALEIKRYGGSVGGGVNKRAGGERCNAAAWPG